MEALPQFVVGVLGVPDDRLRVGERRLLTLVVAIRGLKLQQLVVVALDEALLATAGRALVAAVQTFDRPRHVHAAELLDRVIADPVAERVFPLSPEVAERRRNVGAN